MNDLAHFRVVGGLRPDVMHDILEDIFPLVISKLLVHCMKSTFLTLKTFARVIEHLKYGHREVIDKPCAIHYLQLIEGKMNQSATQVRLLAISSILMMGHFLDKSHPVWRFFTTLLQNCKLIFLQTLSEFEIPKLELLIEEFCMEYTEDCFQPYIRDNPKSKLKFIIVPKKHSLVHGESP